MIPADFHTHTTFSDGANTPEEMAEAAIRKGVKALGFADHAYTPLDESPYLRLDQYKKYIQTVAALKEKYKDRLTILCGIEQDYYSPAPTSGFDYVVGSVHFIRVGEEYVSVDETPQMLKNAADRYFGGDMLKLVEIYYTTVADVVNKTGCDIIGHFDLIAKLNENGVLFDESCPRYAAAVQTAADILIQTGKLFEINTAAMAAGYRTTPYPSGPILEYLRNKGASFVLSSDSHKKENVAFSFDRFSSFALPLSAVLDRIGIEPD